MKKLILLFTILITVISCKNEPDKISDNLNIAGENFNKMLDEYNEEELKLNPMNATFKGDKRYNNSFPNFLSNEYQNKSKTHYTSFLNRLNEFKNSDLTDSEIMSKNILKWECEINLKGLTFRRDFFPIDQMWSINLILGQFASGASAQPFKTVEDYQNWLQRIDEYLIWLKTAETRMREGMSLGYVLPKSLIIKIIPQFESLSNIDLNTHLFFSPIKILPNSFSEENKIALTEAYTQMVQNKIIPAHKEMLNFLSNEYLEKGRESSGISTIPNGKDFYNFQIRKYTTTNMTANEIHQLGLNEVARILVEMKKVKDEVGYNGNLKSFFDDVRTKKELLPFTERQQVIDNFYAIHERMKPQLEKLFNVVPKSKFEVRRTEEFREKSSSAEYNQASLDGSRPGIFYVPIPDVNAYNTFMDEALYLHEAIPGHHYQISLQQENSDLPNFRKTLWYSGYGEGWALYTESLGKELGLFTDPYQYFGMLSKEMHRAIRLV